MRTGRKAVFGMIAGALLSLSPALASAQDFYNGCRGPKAMQVDNYLAKSGSEASGAVILKLFTKNLKKSLPNIVLAIPNTVSDTQGWNNKGMSLGYIVETAHTSTIGAIGLFKDNSGKFAVIDPQVYFTGMYGAWTLDLEGNLPINKNSGEKGGFAAATIGYGVSERLRVGGSIIGEKGKTTSWRANARVELTKDHRYWLQAYLNTNSVGTRLAINLF